MTKDSTKRHDVTPKADFRKKECSSLSTSSKTNVDAKRYLTFFSIEKNVVYNLISFSLYSRLLGFVAAKRI